MKNIRFIYLFLTAALFVSCNAFLDKLPDSRAELNTEENIAKLLTSAYPRSQPVGTVEYMSDNVDFNGNNISLGNLLQEEAFHWQDITSTGSDSPYSVWEACYRAISTANQALEAIDKMGNPESLNHQKGEALLCRAYGHFVLVNFFCLHYDPAKDKKGTTGNDYTDANYYGIPYMTAPETTINSKVDRKNVCYIYELIDRDIEEALPLIEGHTFAVAPKFHFSEEAAYAFASKFNLYYCNFEKAAEYATRALGVAPKDKLRNWAELAGMKQDVSSDIVARALVYVSDKAATNFLMSTVGSTTYSSAPWGGARYAQSQRTANMECVRSSVMGGLRLRGYIWIGTDYPHAVVIKQSSFDEVLNIAGNRYIRNVWIHFTADETLLHRAEAYTMLGEYDLAAEDIRLIVESFTTGTTGREAINSTFGSMVDYTPAQPTAKKRLAPKFEFQQGGEQENFIHAILYCRRYLFCHEGHRWYDIKRWGIEVNHNEIHGGNDFVGTVATLSTDDKRRAIQLPHSVIAAGIPANPR